MPAHPFRHRFLLPFGLLLCGLVLLLSTLPGTSELSRVDYQTVEWPAPTDDQTNAFHLVSAHYPVCLRPGTLFDLRLQVATPTKITSASSHRLKLLLVHASSGIGYQYSTDVTAEDWRPGSTVSLNIQASLPHGMMNGNYRLYLWMPDSDPQRTLQPAASIAFDNPGIWQPDTGYNWLEIYLIIDTKAGGLGYQSQERFDQVCSCELPDTAGIPPHSKRFLPTDSSQP